MHHSIRMPNKDPAERLMEQIQITNFPKYVAAPVRPSDLFFPTTPQTKYRKHLSLRNGEFSYWDMVNRISSPFSSRRFLFLGKKSLLALERQKGDGVDPFFEGTGRKYFHFFPTPMGTTDPLQKKAVHVEIIYCSLWHPGSDWDIKISSGILDQTGLLPSMAHTFLVFSASWMCIPAVQLFKTTYLKPVTMNKMVEFQKVWFSF